MSSAPCKWGLGSCWSGARAGMVRALRAQREQSVGRVRSASIACSARAECGPGLTSPAPPAVRAPIPHPPGAAARCGAAGRVGAGEPLAPPQEAGLGAAFNPPRSCAPVRRRSARAAVPERPRVAMLPAWLRLCLAALLLPPGAAVPPACPAHCRCPASHTLRCREPLTVSSLSALLLGAHRPTDV